MNAGGVSKACKSNDCTCDYIKTYKSGRRERNTLVTFPTIVNNSAKAVLIRDMTTVSRLLLKDLSLWDGPMSYQLVGEVKAHQGYDGYRA